MPVVKGRKTDKEKFSGAEATYTVECMMHDKKALQAGTSHYFGDGFAKAFGIQFTDKDNTLKYVYQTSWGMTTRLIGAIIMVHGDNSGLVLPPKVAPTQIVIIPIQQKKEGVLDTAYQLKDRLSNFRVKVDDSDKSPGWKILRTGKCAAFPSVWKSAPRTSKQENVCSAAGIPEKKIEVALEDLEAKAGELLEQIQTDMLERARAMTDSPVVEYRRAAIEDMRPAPAAWDVVLSSLALHYVEDYAGVCRMVWDALSPGGWFNFFGGTSGVHGPGAAGLAEGRRRRPAALARGPIL